MKHDAATEAQLRAAAPERSTWLSANAGSGKTRVLTNRVARLLLEDVPPQNILCLTYTKAAAGEMQNRLFQTLGEWAMKPDDDLREALAGLGVEEAPDLTKARRLFARAIETPGGLKIQTIHSFCAGLLRRFPLEAGVTPNFTEMDERAAKIVQGEVLEEMAEGPEATALERLAAIYGGDEFTKLMAEISTHREGFAREVDAAEIWRWFGLAPGIDTAALEAQTFAPGDASLLARLPDMLARGSKNDVTAAEALRALPDGLERLEVLEGVFLNKSGLNPGRAKIGSFPTKALREGEMAGVMPELEALMARVEAARELRMRLYSAQNTLALHKFARPFLARYARHKARAGWLDFDDLIARTAALLDDPSVASWVLYRLDGSLDHILVDEAQDTSPAQWRVIERLTGEFATGEGTRPEVPRTIFVVGDPKQSIYSFQGAEPAAFTQMKADFSARLEGVGERLWESQLEYSFRSSPAVLTLVDTAMRDLPGLEDTPPHHIAFHADKPGRVDLWPAIPKTASPEPPDWSDPCEIVADTGEEIVLARQVAGEIGRMLREETILDKESKAWRRIEPRDIIVLVRGRKGGLFDALIQALKQARLPVAGADRLRIGAELAVKDITALLRFLATPEDDLSLAAALRSPLCGWSEAELYALAQPRPKKSYLWNALREAGESDTRAMLDDMRRWADFLRPYDLIERLLTRHGGRARLLARLGAEAEDGIDALLAQALAYERLETPSLTGFLLWLDADDVTAKRQQGTTANQLRVMTVHGAKGLEAPVVFLPDTTIPTRRDRNSLLRLSPEGPVVWKPNKAERPAPVIEAAEAAAQAELEEWVRLLYVAMTRAEQWLVVAAAGKTGEDRQSWYALVENGMKEAGAVDHDFVGGEGLRLQVGQWGEAKETTPGDSNPEVVLPAWAETPAPPPPAPATVLSPSALGGAKALGSEAESGLSEEAAMQRGTQIHRLLEYLPGQPQKDWPALAAQLLGKADEAAELLEEAAGLLTAPHLAPLFGPESLAEVEISTPFKGGVRLHGVIDRLVVTPAQVLAVDFKSNATIPASAEVVPEGILRQMGAYRLALSQIFPGREISTAIVWTRTAAQMDLPDELVAAALQRLDADKARS